MVFVGVTTGDSRINRIFPAWAEILGIAPARLIGMDLPLGVAPDRVRAAIRQIAEDPAARGALVTTHKIAVYRHAHGLFAGFDGDADRLGEVSAVVKSPAGLIGHAKDLVTAGMALDRIVARDHWHTHPHARALVLGSGGAGLALAAHLIERRPAERPKRVILCDVDGETLAHARLSLEAVGGREVVEFRHVRDSGDSDGSMAALPPHSLVVNASGLGKDRPGSPITDAAGFPERGIVWEFNYRGPRRFLQQAEEQRAGRHLTVADGWSYFLYGWAHVIAEVFGIALDAPLFERLEAAADRVR